METPQAENLETKVRTVRQKVIKGLAVVIAIGGLFYLIQGCDNVNRLDAPNIVCDISVNGETWIYKEREPYTISDAHGWIANVLRKRPEGYVEITDGDGNVNKYDIDDPEIQEFRSQVREFYYGLENNKN